MCSLINVQASRCWFISLYRLGHLTFTTDCGHTTNCHCTSKNSPNLYTKQITQQKCEFYCAFLWYILTYIPNCNVKPVCKRSHLNVWYLDLVISVTAEVNVCTSYAMSTTSGAMVICLNIRRWRPTLVRLSLIRVIHLCIRTAVCRTVPFLDRFLSLIWTSSITHNGIHVNLMFLNEKWHLQQIKYNTSWRQEKWLAISSWLKNEIITRNITEKDNSPVSLCEIHVYFYQATRHTCAAILIFNEYL